jgi:uncharacterized protein YegP (UPF0339 family)
MATATTKARASTNGSDGAVVASESVSMEFLIFEDNGGDYHWALMDRDGNSLARSASFSSYQHAEDAARVVLAGAGSARLDPRVDTDWAVDDVARRDDAQARNHTDAERRPDEGGKFSKTARR